MSVSMRIEGMSDCLNWCDKAPEDMVKLAKSAMREGGKAVTRKMRPNIDSRWRRLIKYKVTGGRNDKDLNCGLGFFNGHQQQGKQPEKGAPIDDWCKAYWKNYGTLTKRDPYHQFTKPIRHGNTAAAQRRRNRIGQPHENFFEGAIAGYEDVFFNAFAEHLAKNIDECYDR